MKESTRIEVWENEREKVSERPQRCGVGDNLYRLLLDDTRLRYQLLIKQLIY